MTFITRLTPPKSRVNEQTNVLRVLYNALPSFSMIVVSGTRHFQESRFPDWTFDSIIIIIIIIIINTTTTTTSSSSSSIRRKD